MISSEHGKRPMCKLCVSTISETPEQMTADARMAVEMGASMVELRLDHLNRLDEETVRRVVAETKKLPVEVIATCRITAEGGRYTGDETQRARLLATAAQAGADYIDVEYQAWASSRCRPALPSGAKTAANDSERRSHPTQLILSMHDFEKTPADLADRVENLARQPCDVVKVACRAVEITDALAMLDALRRSARQRPTIALSMDEAGVITRVLAGKFGAFLTFTALARGRESAPGQVSLTEMRDLYRWETIGPDTAVYGVIGCPVAHSMSPAVLNAAFGAAGHDGVYLPLRVEPAYDDFAAFLDGCLARPWLQLRGCSVTIPHKQNLLRYVAQRGGRVEPLAERIGAANTLCIEPGRRDDGSDSLLAAYNTDYRGAMDALLAGVGRPASSLRDAKIAVLGAGGAARAIVAGLRDAGAAVTLYNRTAAKAQALAEEFGCRAEPWERRSQLAAEIVINCTSIGMWPDTDATPLPDVRLPAGTVVFDTVYNPIETRLLQEARRQGCTTIDGVAMFVNQAAAQFTLWTGRPAPTEVMRQVVIDRLSR